MHQALRFSLYILLICSTTHAQENRSLAGKKETIYPLVSTGNDSTYIPLQKIFTPVDIVGLGEMTHGSREFNDVRIELLKYLFSHCDYRSLVVEGSFNSFLFIDGYVNGEDGPVDSLLRNTGYWMFYTPEVKGFFNWIREFNQTLPAGEKVHVYGMDMQITLDAPWLLQHTSKKLSIAARTGLDSILQPLLKGHHISQQQTIRSVSKIQQQAISSAVPLLYRWYALHQAEIDSVLFPGRAGLAYYCIRNMDFSVQSLAGDQYHRDTCMRKNVQAIDSISKYKIAVWAHNYHIGRDDEKVFYAGYRRMLGQQLSDIYGSRYYPVGTLFQEGSFMSQELITENGKSTIAWLNSFELPPDRTHHLSRQLGLLSDQPFFINIRDSKNPVWKKTSAVYMAGGTARTGDKTVLNMHPASMFDGIIFIKKVTAITQLDDAIRKVKK